MSGEAGSPGENPSLRPPEQRNNVKILVGLGVPQAMICQLVVNPQTGNPLDEGSLKKHFPREIAVGAAELHARMGSFSERGCGRLPVVTISLLPMECRNPDDFIQQGLHPPTPRQSIDNPTASAPGRREPFSTVRASSATRSHLSLA